MRRSSAVRVLFLVSLGAAALGSVLFACTDEATTPAGSAGDDGGARRRPDGSGPEEPGDGGVDLDGGGDASPPSDASPKKDANGPGEAGTECFFNRECQAALRCECDDEDGCKCRPGARGVGQNGIDGCDSGNQCASSVCVEGPTNGAFICSDECQGPADCTGSLPRCIPVFGFPEPICAREVR